MAHGVAVGFGRPRVARYRCNEMQDVASTTIAELGADCATATDANNDIWGACSRVSARTSRTDRRITDDMLDITKFRYLQAPETAVLLNEPNYIASHLSSSPSHHVFERRRRAAPHHQFVGNCLEDDMLADNVDTRDWSPGSTIFSAVDTRSWPCTTVAGVPGPAAPTPATSSSAL
ncbi:hypothetical protein H310_13570 [Aphanomyces invadans]|uniref:Uncharacterized protein n=1 Tax=Aphanomyces invadans TaxID=157072 RepID=A0A024TD05_9STRA|nr:hypothetical protein H310_13570 [Aphanomyces invadans]ETV92045.1 hypothetical protein H310_13570 [Aphanomyces invadans]|eukprot:XP_008879342.1 hypothetical protein H310_13570 [Aphanomyces invadans]